MTSKPDKDYIESEDAPGLIRKSFSGSLSDLQEAARLPGIMEQAMLSIKYSPTDALLKSAGIIESKDRDYGDIGENFGRAAAIASGILGKTITRYEIAAIMVAVKLGRMKKNRMHADNYDDGVSYLSFMKMFIGDK